MISKTALKKLFNRGSKSHIEIFNEVMRYGTISQDKRIVTGYTGLIPIDNRWINVTHHDMQWQIYMRSGKIEYINMSTNPNLF